MADVPDLNIPPDQLSHRERHDVSLPLTGAVFDLLVEIFQQNLVDRGLIHPGLDAMSRRGMTDQSQLDAVDRHVEKF